MGRLTYSLETLANGIQVARAYCWKCGGRGYLPGFEFSDNARCWACGGHHGSLGEISVEEYTRREARNAKARARAQAKREAKALARLRAEQEAYDTWMAGHVEICARIRNYTGSSEFLRDTQDAMAHRLELSDRRLEIAARILDEAERATSVPAGRQQITGTVRSTKWVENGYGGTLKMLVDCGTFRVYGTMPLSLEASTGDQVTFTATVEPKETGFALFSRPRVSKKEVAA